MGFRTLVIVSNDRLDEVQDPVLKDAILGYWAAEDKRWMKGPYRIVEQTHCDNSSLMAVQHLDAKTLGTGHWDADDHDLSLVKNAADRLGYRLVKKK